MGDKRKNAALFYYFFGMQIDLHTIILIVITDLFYN